MAQAESSTCLLLPLLLSHFIEQVSAACREPGSAAVQDAAPEQISGVGAAAVSQPLVDRYAPKPRHVDRVVLVGGSSLMPWVAAGLQSFTGSELAFVVLRAGASICSLTLKPCCTASEMRLQPVCWRGIKQECAGKY